MSVSYKKLWKLLIDKDMKKKGSLRKGWHQPSLRYQNGAKRSCHDGDPFENLHGAGLSGRRYNGNRAGSKISFDVSVLRCQNFAIKVPNH